MSPLGRRKGDDRSAQPEGRPVNVGGDRAAIAAPESGGVAMATLFGAAPSVSDPVAAGLKNMHQLIQLRWIALGGQLATIAAVHFGFGIRLPLDAMLTVLACLAGFNILSLLRWRRHREVSNGELFLALLLDVATLTALLGLSGGATNPFIFLYLLQVMLAAVLLEPWSTWTMVGVTSACFAGLATWAPPLALPVDHDGGLASPYVQGMWICFALNAALAAVFIKRINRNLRARDARLADLRQRAAEEEHIVRMGLLASGAAHELGTPLATLSVILGDWRRMPAFKASPELLQEIGEMQTQLQRCKSIVSGILLSAGEARGEATAKTTVAGFLDDLVREWSATRHCPSFEFDDRFVDGALPMVSDSTLRQTIHNVLDNALEASPDRVRLVAVREGDALRLEVCDAGPGFAPEMLAQLGKPYRSTKGRPGGGLGLFLVVNTVRTLGGSVAAHNRDGGGACVRLLLPLASITLDPKADDDGRR